MSRVSMQFVLQPFFNLEQIFFKRKDENTNPNSSGSRGGSGPTARNYGCSNRLRFVDLLLNLNLISIQVCRDTLA